MTALAIITLISGVLLLSLIAIYLITSVNWSMTRWTNYDRVATIALRLSGLVALITSGLLLALNAPNTHNLDGQPGYGTVGFNLALACVIGLYGFIIVNTYLIGTIATRTKG